MKIAHPHLTHAPSLELGLIDRLTLAARWRCSVMSLKRMQRDGRLQPVTLGKRLIRYRLADIVTIEAATNPGVVQLSNR